MTRRGFTSNSALAREIGANPSEVGRWLAGQTTVSIANLRKLAPVLGVTPIELLIEAGYLPRHETMEAVRLLAERWKSDERSAG